jgi:hypothetical protein
VKQLQPLHLKLFEYDERFQIYGFDFQHFDYSNANEADYLDEYAGTMDLLVVDPPFLSEECVEKFAKIVSKMSKPTSKIIMCSGKMVQEWVEKHMNLKLCNFQPEHERNLGNEFASYANFNLDEVVGVQ